MIPSPEKVREAGEMLDNMRDDLIEAEKRAAYLEASVKEMEAEHADSIRDMQNAHASEVTELRRRLHAAEKLNDAHEQRIHVLETNANIRLLSTERVATILSLVRDAVNKGADDFLTAEVDAMQSDRETRREPEAAQYNDGEGGVRVVPLDRRKHLQQLEDELGSFADRLLENPHEFPQDDGRPAPAFLKRGPSVVGPQ